MTELIVAGADGCPAGWACVTLTTGGVEAQTFASASELIDFGRSLSALAIDIPIGLPEAGPRHCDTLARKLLGVRRSSVFPAPVRAVLQAQSYTEACTIRDRVEGKAMSKQSFAIIPKITDIDQRMTPAIQRTVFEVHPELCFRELNGGEPMQDPKRSLSGGAARLGLIERELGAGCFAAARRSITKSRATDDDILDALAAAWTARRRMNGKATCIPAQPQIDARGLRMEMWV